MKAEVAAEAAEAGCDLINDVSGLSMTDEMLSVIKNTGLCCCLMHNKREAVYNDFRKDMITELQMIADRALKAGINRDRIILDPGVGFAKSYEQNLKVLGSLYDYRSLGYPLLLGASRKSVIGLTLDLPVSERLEGTLAATAAAVYAGCSFVRVHDVRENFRFIRMLEAVRGCAAGE